MVEYFKSIKLPFSDFNKLAIGAVLYMIPLVNLITGMFATGYILETGKNAMKKKFTMPGWHHWGKLFVNGLLAAIIALIYLIPAMILMFIGLGSRIITGAESGIITSIVVVGIIIGAFTFYILPNSLMQFVYHEHFSAAFELKEIFKKSFTGKYLGAWIIAVLYTLIFTIIGSAISSILEFTIILPFIISGFVQFAVGITMLTIIAQAYAEIGISKTKKR